MNKISNILITTYIFLAYTSNAFAEKSNTETQRVYNIEIIIFEDAHSRYIDSELWHDNKQVIENVDEINTEIKIPKQLPESNEANFNNIEPEILTQQYQNLKRSSQFNVLFRGAWRQAGLPENEAFEVDLKNLSNTHDNKTENTVSGKLKIVLARYLHFYSQLEYQKESDPEDLNNEISSEENLPEVDADDISNKEEQNTTLISDRKTYPIQNHRRMRSKELHYIDHPLVGILIQINPVEIMPENNEQSEQADASQSRNDDLTHR